MLGGVKGEACFGWIGTTEETVGEGEGVVIFAVCLGLETTAGEFTSHLRKGGWGGEKKGDCIKGGSRSGVTWGESGRDHVQNVGEGRKNEQDESCPCRIAQSLEKGGHLVLKRARLQGLLRGREAKEKRALQYSGLGVLGKTPKSTELALGGGSGAKE